MLKIQDIPYKLPAFFTMDSMELADFQIVRDQLEFIGRAIHVEGSLKFYAIYKHENIYDYKFIVACKESINWSDINIKTNKYNQVLCLYSQRWDREKNQMRVYRHLCNHSLILNWITDTDYIVSSMYQYLCDIYGIRCDSDVVYIDEDEQWGDIRECQSNNNYIQFDPIEGGGGIHNLSDANIKIMDDDPIKFVKLYISRTIDNTSWVRTVVKNDPSKREIRLNSFMFSLINLLNNIPIQNACIYYYIGANKGIEYRIENISFWSGCNNSFIERIGHILYVDHTKTCKGACDGIKFQYLNEEIKITKYFDGNEISSSYILLPMAELINPMLHIRPISS